MTKRAYPFEGGVLRQFKMHINNFECDKESRKEIQNKTVQKLFSAQKDRDLTHYNNNYDRYLNANGRSLVQKQVSSYFTCSGVNSTNKNPKNDVIINRGMSNCSYCDCITECTYKCNVCSEPYCQACSFADYNAESDEIRICLTCS